MHQRLLERGVGHVVSCLRRSWAWRATFAMLKEDCSQREANAIADASLSHRRWRRCAVPAACSAQAQDYPTKPGSGHFPGGGRQQPGRCDAPGRRPARRSSGSSRSSSSIGPGAGGLIAAQAASGRRRRTVTRSTWRRPRPTRCCRSRRSKMPFDLHKAFVPIGLIATQPIAVSVNAQARHQLARRIDGADQAKRPAACYSRATNRGGQSHLTGELFARKTGLELTFVQRAGRRRPRSTTSRRAASRSSSKASPASRGAVAGRR